MLMVKMLRNILTFLLKSLLRITDIYNKSTRTESNKNDKTMDVEKNLSVLHSRFHFESL